VEKCWGDAHHHSDERDPGGSNKTALIAEIPDIEAFQEVMKSEAAADAMKHDGVNRDTLLMFSEA
jgi:hypothetical protein